jgi:hypothetical protein
VSQDQEYIMLNEWKYEEIKNSLGNAKDYIGGDSFHSCSKWWSSQITYLQTLTEIQKHKTELRSKINQDNQLFTTRQF